MYQVRNRKAEVSEAVQWRVQLACSSVGRIRVMAVAEPNQGRTDEAPVKDPRGGHCLATGVISLIISPFSRITNRSLGP